MFSYGVWFSILSSRYEPQEKCKLLKHLALQLQEPSTDNYKLHLVYKSKIINWSYIIFTGNTVLFFVNIRIFYLFNFNSFILWWILKLKSKVIQVLGEANCLPWYYLKSLSVIDSFRMYVLECSVLEWSALSVWN